MTNVTRLLPREHEISLDEIAVTLKNVADIPLSVATTEAKELCSSLSQKLLSDPKARHFSELQALGFWLRPASLESLLNKHLVSTPGVYRAPAGVVFQIPPSNVDVVFGYSLALSLLCGNVTIVRLSETHPHPAQQLFVAILSELLETAPRHLRDRILLLRYGHDNQITAALSALCDVRMIWGSNETIQNIRQFEIGALARDISFGNRFSTFALHAGSYLSLDAHEVDQFVKHFFNDVYEFDQLACSSPRLLVWVGNKAMALSAADDLYPRILAYAQNKGRQFDVGENLAKLNSTCLALYDLTVESCKIYGPQLSVVKIQELGSFSHFKNINYGYGLIIETCVEDLPHLAHHAERCDQTLVVAGFDRQEINNFVELCAGRGFDRVVPLGQALNFDVIWDGINLFETMTRLVQVKYD